MKSKITNNQFEEFDEMTELGSGKFILFGILSILTILILMIVLGSIIKYPIVEKGRCTIYADNPPKPVISGTDGKLSRLLVSEGTYAKKNQPLGIIYSGTRYEDVLKLETLILKCLESIQNNKLEEINIYPNQLNLAGDFKGPIQHFYWTYRQLRLTTSSPLYKYISKTSNIIEGPKENLQKIPNNLSEFEERFFDILTEFLHSINDLNNQITSWKQKYVLTAPIDGRVVFLEELFKNKDIIVGKEILYIDPLVKNYYAQVDLAPQSFDKVRNGQPVIIELEGSYKTHGPLHGSVMQISPIINHEGKIVVNVEFDKSQIDKTKQPIFFINQFKGSAVIITRSASFLSRLIESIQY